tara:strand:+ start:4430 stop:4807 length:378 start_codon:yes stop_codon:yes gene_type:complete
MQKPSQEEPGLTYTDEGEIQWAAGVYEGEGYLYFNASQDSWTIGLEMCDKDVIDKMATLFPFNVTDSKRNNRAEHHQQPYHARVSARKTIFAIVCQLYPYLHARRREKCNEFLAWYAAKENMRFD